MKRKFNQACSRFLGVKSRSSLTALAALGLVALLCVSGCASTPAVPESRTDGVGVTEKLGIRPVAIRLTAAGNMVDFRYSVLEPRKSRPMFDRKLRTYLLNEATGDMFAVPTNSKLGPLRSSSREPVAGKEYFIFFVNPGRPLKRGDKVAVVVGDMKIENLTLE